MGKIREGLGDGSSRQTQGLGDRAAAEPAAEPAGGTQGALRAPRGRARARARGHEHAEDWIVTSACGV